MLQRYKGKFAAVLSAASLAVFSTAAMATSSAAALTTAFTDGFDEATMWAIGGLVLTAAGIVFMIRRSQKAAN